MTMKTRIVLIASAAIIVSAVSGFSRELDNTIRSELVVAFSAGELTMDPLHAYRTTELQIATGIYEGLVVYDPQTLRPKPGGAYRWEINDDGTVYRFYLRQRARFSNGERVTAYDYRESWLRILDPRDEGEYSFLFDVIQGAYEYRSGRETDAATVGIRVVNDHVLEVELVRPASHFLSMLCHMTFSPIHKSYRETAGWETYTPLVTNGPYTLAGWNDDAMTLTKNDEYWDVWNVAIPSVRIDFGYSNEEATGALNDGSLQWSLYADAQGIENTDIIQVAPLFATSYLYFRSDAAPWNDARVRKGLAKLVPWNELRREYTACGTTTLVPTFDPYPRIEGISGATVDEGLDLLAEAGFPKGEGLPIITILVIPGSVADAVATALKGIWEEQLEVSVEIERVSFRDYQDEIRRGGYTVGASTWIGDFADPLAFLQMWTGTSKLNDARYVDAAYDEMITRAMGENGESRYETLSKAEIRLIVEEMVVLPLSHTVSINFIDTGAIGGWSPNALDVHPFKNIYYRRPAAPKWYAALPSMSADEIASAIGG